MSLRFHLLVLAVAPVAGTANPSLSDVVEYENAAQWQAAVGAYTTINFAGFQSGTIITDQFAGLGVHFPDGNDITFAGPSIFPNDGMGLRGHIVQPSGIHIAFDSVQHWLAVEFPGFLDINLYRNGELIYESSILGLVEIGNFGGLVSTIGFDEAHVFDSGDNFVYIDDLHFGVPGPGALSLLALAGMTTTRQRRKI